MAGSKDVKPKNSVVLNLNDRRRAHNDQLIDRMRRGDSLWAFDSQSSWFPPRPIIKKDEKSIKTLYEKDVKNEDV